MRYSLAQAAQLLGLSLQRIRQLVGSGIGEKVGWSWILSDADLDKLKSRNEEKRGKVHAVDSYPPRTTVCGIPNEPGRDVSGYDNSRIAQVTCSRCKDIMTRRVKNQEDNNG